MRNFLKRHRSRGMGFEAALDLLRRAAATQGEVLELLRYYWNGPESGEAARAANAYMVQEVTT